MAALPWWRVMTGTSGHAKVHDLCELLGDDKADAFVFRLWDHCAEKQGSGRFEGVAPGRLVERAVRFAGTPGTLADAMLRVGLLEQEDGALVVHDWAEVQSALAAKFERDRARPNSRKRNPSANADELQSGGNSPPSRTGFERDMSEPRTGFERVPPGASPSLLSVSSSKGVQGETRPAAHAAFAPSLVERLAATFKRKRGADYGLNAWGEPMPQDLAGLKSALQQAKGDEGEVERRWEVALDWPGWPTCGCLADLGRFWNRYAAAKAAAPGDVRRGVVRAEDARHAPAGEVKL